MQRTRLAPQNMGAAIANLKLALLDAATVTKLGFPSEVYDFSGQPQAGAHGCLAAPSDTKHGSRDKDVFFFRGLGM